MNFRIALAALAIAALTPSGLGAQDKGQSQPGGDKIDKKVLEVVKQTGDLYKNAKSMHAEGTFATKISGQGQDREVNVTAVYDVEKPNRLSLRTQVGGDTKKGPDVVADGKKLIVYRKALGQYTEQDSPQGLAEIGLGLLRVGRLDTGMLFANILGDDPADLLMQGVTSCSYVGTDKVDGTPVHRMKFSQEGFDWELWVASEGKPYALRMVVTAEGPNGKMHTTETYKNWKLDAAPGKETFTFTAPADATKVKAFSTPGREP
jgi:hypothetical protein